MLGWDIWGEMLEVRGWGENFLKDDVDILV
jgi:hypothetical protein